jgi:hypothetical protein
MSSYVRDFRAKDTKAYEGKTVTKISNRQTFTKHLQQILVAHAG